MVVYWTTTSVCWLLSLGLILLFGNGVEAAYGSDAAGLFGIGLGAASMCVGFVAMIWDEGW